MMTEEQTESLQRRQEWQDQFTMCGNFRWHLTAGGCDCAADGDEHHGQSWGDLNGDED